MLKLSFKIALIFFTLSSFAQSPHGIEFKADCASCHNSKSWKVARNEMKFDHNTTQFKLTGQHQAVDCKSCHQTLKFQEAKSECASCHTDMHSNTLGPDCARCHDTKSWIIANTRSMHQMSRFPLQGNHAVVDCAACHKSSTNLQFEPLGVECVNCHRNDYLATKAPNHQQSSYSTNCIECHGVKATGWTTTSFEHGFFPLTEGHQINCIECHKTGSYQKISNECVTCHQKNYNSTTNPNHQQTGFSTSCAECHTTSPGWSPSNFIKHDALYFPIYSGAHKGEWNNCTDCHTNNNYSSFSCTNCHEHSQSKMDDEHKGLSGYSYKNNSCYGCHPQGTKSGVFNHNTTNFPLTGAHTKTECVSCHSSSFSGTSSECNSCHQKNFTEAQNPNHTKAGLPVDCKTCHTSAAWQPSTFKHGTTGFELTGGHAAVAQCSSCHLGSTTTTSSACISCHQVQYNNAKGHVASKFPTDCKMCHNSTNWLQATFDHNTTNFPLTGSHKTTLCASCHKTTYAGTSMECKSCHLAKYNAAQVPSHTAAGISVECKSCHTSTDWKPSSFNHTTTGFALTGAHTAIVQCSSCHKGNTTSAKPDCFSCHQAQYNTAKDHLASKFPTDCKMCHSSTNWLQTTFNHSTTNFPLTGAHTTVLCASCHASGYTGTSMECKSCHLTKYNAAQVPSHTAAGISVECKSCHTTTDWKPSSFNHTTTGFALTGGHSAVVQCSACHKGNTTSASSECISCHQAQYNTAKDHLTSKFPTDCKLCHNSTNWLQTNFNHSTTNFPLTGAHTTVLCASCHAAGYAGTSMECKSCHLAKYNSAQIPSHTAAGISVECKSCHTTNDWKPSSFNHTTTGFALTGGHAAIVQCSACHKGNTTSATPDCFSCHQAQYNNAKDHVASKFPTDCKICHNSTNWLQTSFNHSTTAFPLTGAHTTVLCASCHTTGYAGTSTQCNSCHMTAYNSSANPNHKTLALPVTCADCHSTNPGWQPATFAIHNNYYALTGAHSAIANNCASCHNGTYMNTPNTCYGCHATDYNTATNPNHKTAQFPTDCKPCHSTSAWTPSTFNHDSQYFPIYSGKHQGKWTLCSECHTSTTNFALFSCIKCHEHSSKTSVDNDHQGVRGYTYTATSCYTCHPMGN
jgi:hypothetical protein